MGSGKGQARRTHGIISRVAKINAGREIVKEYKDEASGELHRDDGPALLRRDGTEEWYKHGKLHREDGPAIEGGASAGEQWYLNGQRHREDGPAVDQPDGHQSWWRHGQKHRFGGPAITWAAGDVEWWVYGVEMSEAEARKAERLKRVAGLKLGSPEKVTF